MGLYKRKSHSDYALVVLSLSSDTTITKRGITARGHSAPGPRTPSQEVPTPPCQDQERTTTLRDGSLSRKDGRENDRDAIDETCALLAGKNVPIDHFLS